MNMKNEDQQQQPKLIRISQGQYEIIGGTDEDILAAKQWAKFWGHQIVSRPKCFRRKIPPLFRYQIPLRGRAAHGGGQSVIRKRF